MKCSVSEKAQWIKAPDAKPDDLNSVFRIHMMKGKNWLWKFASVIYMLDDTHATTHMYTHMYIHTHTNNKKFKAYNLFLDRMSHAYL